MTPPLRIGACKTMEIHLNCAVLNDLRLAIGLGMVRRAKLEINAIELKQRQKELVNMGSLSHTMEEGMLCN
jgi:hypothetical protein